MSRSSKKNLNTFLIVCVIVLISIVIRYIQDRPSDGAVKQGGDSEFTLHIIDVGQGDAAFIDNGDHDILIDSGTGMAAPELLSYLDGLGVASIEYAFFSHPHEDHIGGADDVLEHYSVANVVMPYAKEDTACYYRLMQSVRDEGAELIYASAGDSFEIGEASIQIFSPEAGSTYNDANLVSLVMKVSYGDIDYLFTGDAETENEEYILNNYFSELDCEVLKVGHHGSSTSSSEEFLFAVSPDIALISVGEENMYGHPHVETLANLNRYVDEIYRTDRIGDIVICCDGKNVWYNGK